MTFMMKAGMTRSLMMSTALRKQTINTLKLGHYSKRTIKTYLDWLIRLSQHYNRSPAVLSEQEVQAFLLYLIEKRKLAWSTVNQALASFRFLYEKVLHQERSELRVPARRKVTRRACVYSTEQVARLLAAAHNPKHRALLMCVYGAGLRVSEVVVLKPKHLESDRGLIRVEDGKGCKDRYTVLPDRLLRELRDYYRCFRPGEWLFFGRDRSKPMPIGSAQKIFYLVRNRAGIDHGGIHTLRHSFATHMLEAGADIFEIKRMMGHSAIKTTAGYIHISKEHLMSVESPLDTLPR
jgi:integrase/recombinase XerD